MQSNGVLMVVEGRVMTDQWAVRKLYLMHEMNPKCCKRRVQVLDIKSEAENGFALCSNSLGNEK